MRRTHPFLRLALIFGIVFVVLGLARGWFYFSKTTEPDDKVNVHFTVDTQKVRDDSAKAKRTAEEFGDTITHERPE